MRVLVLCEYASLNGGERSFLEAARRITASDVEVTVAAPATGPLAAALRQYGLRHQHLDLMGLQGIRPPRDEIRQQIADCITRSRAVLVHANSVSMSRLSGPVAEQMGIPSMGHLRDIIRLSRASIEDLNRHQCLLAVSQATRQWYIAAGLNASRTSVAYNGVDLNRFQPRPATGSLQQELGLPPDTLLVASVGQIGMRKGVDLFVDAAARVAATRPDVQFIYVGQRYSQKEEAVTFESDVRQIASHDALRGRFHFLGVRDDMERILNDVALYVHAARQEPLGRVLLEAAAAGTAIIATDVGGTREIFPDAFQAACLVEPQSVSALAEPMQRLLQDPEIRRSMGTNARQRMVAAFDAERASRDLLQWYRAIGSKDR